jgi:HAD superfamily hydrolase (TIGR01509 family)
MLRVAQPPIDTILLDVDGTLVDSNDAHAYAWFEALADAGFPAAFSRLRSLIGMGADKLLPALGIGLSASEPPGKNIADRQAEIFEQRYLPSILPMPGARELLETLKRNQTKCVIATSSREDQLDPLLRVAEVAELIDTKATSDDAEESKPSADIVHAALLKARVRVANAVMLGDTKYDVQAAHAAGIAAITLRCGGSSDTDLANSAAIFDSPHELAVALESRSLREIVTFACPAD